MGGSDGGGGGGSSEVTTTVRYAGYIESRHKKLLDESSSDGYAIYHDSPYDNYQDVDVDHIFLGTSFELSSFPVLYDMFGKFMAGLDIEVLFTQMHESTLTDPAIGAASSAHSRVLSEDIENEVIPRFELGMRDINAVNTSSFIVGKAIIESKRLKEVAKFDSELRARMIPIAFERWKTHLGWNEKIIMTYANLIKFYMTAKIDMEGFNYEMNVKNMLWPFTVMDFMRINLSALQGAQVSTTKDAAGGRSGTSSFLGGALTGAGVGAMTGGVPGALIGGAVGGLASLFG